MVRKEKKRLKDRFHIGRRGSTAKTGQPLRRYMLVLSVVSFAMFLRFYDQRVDPYNSTILAFSYQYGFVSRGLVGTVYQFVNKITPFNMISYQMVMRFTLVITLLFHLLLFYFFWVCLRRCKEQYLQNLEYVILFCALLTVSMFFSRRNFGRLDIYMLALSLVAALILMKERPGWIAWLVVPISALGVMVHQGYVFMYLNVILVLLIYKALSAEGKRKRYYLLLAGASFVVASALFLWFELFSHGNGAVIYDEIVTMAGKLSYKGQYHDTLIAHEILGEDLTVQEWPMHLENFIETPIFLFLISPYIVLGVKLMRGIIAQAGTRVEKWKYRIVALGAVTMLPMFVLKVDYGRWFFAVIMYYAVILLVLTAMGDKIVETQLFGLMVRVKEKYSWSMLLLFYPVYFMPFWDVHICVLLKNISNPLNEAYFHIW